AEPAQRLGALILSPDQGAHFMAFGEEQCGEVAADGTEIAGRSGNEDRAVMGRFHRQIASLYLPSSPDRGTPMTGPAPGRLRAQRRGGRPAPAWCIYTILSMRGAAPRRRMLQARRRPV